MTSFHSSPPPPPRLLPDLRLALACLYNLPLPHQHHQHAVQQQQQQQQQLLSLGQAQEFLIYVQSRNIRRKLESLIQRQRDKPQAMSALWESSSSNNNSSAGGWGGEAITAGSSWLACLALLCQQQQQHHGTTTTTTFAASNSERLFAAQSLVHRLLRSKLREAIDLEMELAPSSASSSSSCGRDHEFISYMYQQLQQQPLPLQPIMEHYQQFLQDAHNNHPFVNAVVSQYHVPSLPDADEERVKGEISLLTLTAILYITAVESYQHSTTAGQHSTLGSNRSDHDGNSTTSAGPLLNAIGSAIAAIALRLRFPPANNPRNQHQQQQPTGNTLPLVTMMTQSLTLVFHTALSSLQQLQLQLQQQQQHPYKYKYHWQACSDCFRACLAALPEICLGRGARGRMSIDPKCLQEAARELKTTGIALLWEVLQQHFQDMQQQQQQASNNSIQQEQRVHESILIICERWARFLPLPLEFLQHTMPLASRYIHVTGTTTSQQFSGIRKAAFSYLVAIYEGGTWSVDQILAKNVGASPEQQAQYRNQQPGKKRQTSKSKRRQEELIKDRTTDALFEEARMEANHRGAMACHTTAMAWEPLKAAFRAAMEESNNYHQHPHHHHHHHAHYNQNNLATDSINTNLDDDDDDDDDNEIEIDGEGPIGCLAACASACLPHLLRTSVDPGLAFPQSQDLFASISEAFQDLCRSQHRVIRAFSMEPIFQLHEALIKHLLEHETTAGVGQKQTSLDDNLQAAIVQHFFNCSMNLATSCGYPEDYFHNLGAESDEALEIERNDVRDILRTVTVSERGGSTAFADCSRQPFDVTLQVLAMLLRSCADAVQTARDNNRLFPETAIHCFSALAKPLNQLSKCYAKSGQPPDAVDILRLALQIFRTSLQSVIDAFPSAALSQLFPDTRVEAIAIASISPMLSNLCTLPAFEDEVQHVLRLSLNVSALSVSHLPELVIPSILGNALYDIRGAMRGPGGEDHVGCLALMRLASESNQLTEQVVRAAGADIQQLCQLHSQLKAIESSREKGSVHGTGVTPKSRRILLGVICHVEIVSKGAAGCAGMLTDLFSSAISAIASYARADPSSLDDENLIFQMCENTWDLTAFSPVTVSSLFCYEGDAVPEKLDCLRILTASICRGYQRLSISEDPLPVDFQWNRLRAAFFTLIRIAIFERFPDQVVDALDAITRSECEAAHLQCQAGPASSSSIFHDEIVSSESVPAGLFVRVIGAILEKAHENSTTSDELVQKCAVALHRLKAVVLPTIFLRCADPEKFVDPRPTICEAWLVTMTTLAKMAADGKIKDEHEQIKTLLVDTCAAVVTMPLYPVLSKSRDVRTVSFMNLEGPLTLAFDEFLCSYFELGPAMLQQVSQLLLRTVPIDVGNPPDRTCYGTAIVGAALFRAAQGALPPWSVEFIPELFASFFIALGKDANAFGQMLHLSMETRLSAAFGSVQPGELIAPIFDNVTESAKRSFLEESVEQCRLDSMAGWKRIKVLVKKITGGKKQGTDFFQKPTPTKWYDFERL